MSAVDPDAFEETLREYVAEHAFHDHDHARLLELVWREVGGQGGLVDVYEWAERFEWGAIPSMTLGVLHAAGWARARF